MTKARGGFSSKQNSKKRGRPSSRAAVAGTHSKANSSKSLLFVSRLLNNMDLTTEGKGEEELEAELTLKEKMRAAHVKRWHIVRTLREQNVAEHSFIVMLIATDILKRGGNDPDQMGAIHGELGYEALRWAMWHDLMEVKTGDIATPTKRFFAKAVSDKLISDLEESFSAQFKRISDTTTATSKIVVKLADMIEAIAFIGAEGHGGHAEEVKEYLIAGLQSYLGKMPYSYFHQYGRAAEAIANELGIPLENRK